MNNDILNHSLHLSMEFGENWLVDINNRIQSKFPELNQSEISELNQLCKKVNKLGNDFVRQNPIKNAQEIQFVEFSLFETFMKEKFNWINQENLKQLYSQSCYYALK